MPRSRNPAGHRRPAAFPGVLVTSAREGSGFAELRAAIGRLPAERGLR
jgi:GTP-binding protein